MDRWSRHAPAPVSRLLSLGVLPRLSALISLLALVIQLIIPVAQIWHIVTDHTSVVTLSEHGQTGQPTMLRSRVESHRHHEFDNSIDCPACHAFVSVKNVMTIQAQVVADVERSLCQLPLTRLVAFQTFHPASAPRAPPIFS